MDIFGRQEKLLTFRLFPVGDPHRADTVRLRSQVFKMDDHFFTSLSDDHRALNTCDHKVLKKKAV